MSHERMLIIDGNSLLHRAFYAIPYLATSGGLPTNAVYGFTNMLFKVLEEEKPDYIAIAFDKSRVTFRNQMYEGYKAKRKATPEELRPQFAMLKKILAAMRIPTYEIEGFEADDIIGTIATLAENEGLKNIILTGDKDSLQLVSPHTLALITKKGISELEIFDVDAVMKEFKVSPEQFADFKGLMGDPSDNIPGVPGIGKKYASKLIEEYGSVEEVIKNADSLTPKLKNTLTTNSELAILSKKLSQI
ncbi:MAG TPA: 5'-3' exonuclease H3TH domain-containing protein, partial [Clostridia bacterium]|nr:5'-3' exonuclease H3TH domain-containing protein [Clostridia bacterium]